MVEPNPRPNANSVTHGSMTSIAPLQVPQRRFEGACRGPGLSQDAVCDPEELKAFRPGVRRAIRFFFVKQWRTRLMGN